MSKGKWKYDPLTGLTKPALAKLDEAYLNADGTFNAALFPDCNLFATSSRVAAAGRKDVGYLETLVATNPELVHTYPIPDEDGKVVIRATHTSSWWVGVQNLKAKADESHRAAAALPRKRKPKTNQSSGNT